MFGIDLVIVRAILDFESVGDNVTKINYGTMNVDRNLAPGYAVQVASTNTYITKYLGAFDFLNTDRRHDFAHLNGILNIQFGIQHLGGLTVLTRYPKIWIGSNGTPLIDYEGE